MTEEEKQKLQTKAAQGAAWVSLFEVLSESMGLNPKDNPIEFRSAETLFWIGIVQGIRCCGVSELDKIPDDIQMIIYAKKSPVLDHKVKQVRIRKPRAKKEEANEPTQA